MGIHLVAEMIDGILLRVKLEINGRFANAGNGARHLLQAVQDAGDGNYLEIGVLHGGSLCAVAMLKNALGHSGVCVGVDPFNGWYGNGNDKTGVPVTVETARDNLERFELHNYMLMVSKSADFTTDKRFAVTYIDGDHTEAGVWADWIKVKDMTDKFVVFHDYGLLKGVTASCNRAAKDPKWSIHLKAKSTFILQKEGK